MSITEASLETNFNTYIADPSTDRVSAAERLQFATESVIWLQQELENEHQDKTYVLNYFDNVHYYKTTQSIASMLEGADLRRAEKDQVYSFAHKSARELAEEIGQKFMESSWAIERHDNDSYLVVNHKSKYPATIISPMESLTEIGGTWVVDAVNSDATNLTIDNVEFKTGNGCFNFDITVAQSSNNRATIQNLTASTLDLTNWNDLGSWIFWVYLPTVTNFSSVTFYWGSDTSNYWSATVTTDINGNAWMPGWNRVGISWKNATQTLSPVLTAIDYLRFDFNYTVSQANDTDYRIDDLTICDPEQLTFYYTSWYVGTDTTGATPLTAFSATTDIPYFSGQYDQYKYAVSHKMASLAFYGPLQVPTLGSLHEREALTALARVKKLVPSSVTKEMKSFKVLGIRFNGGRYRNNRIRI